MNLAQLNFALVRSCPEFSGFQADLRYPPRAVGSIHSLPIVLDFIEFLSIDRQNLPQADKDRLLLRLCQEKLSHALKILDQLADSVLGPE